MPRVVWLRRASLLAAAVAVACGTDTIDLLPIGAGGSVIGSGGSSTSGNASMAGAESPTGGRPDSAGASGSSGAVSGLGGSALTGGASGSGGCNGFGCGAGGGDDGFGGDFGECKEPELFCPCGPQGRCVVDTKCNERLGLCTPKCDNPSECPWPGLLCEDHSCAPCSEDAQCEQYGGFGRRVCVEGRCEECAGPSDCPEDSPMCVGQRCIQCLTNEDCPSRVCNKARGRCEK